MDPHAHLRGHDTCRKGGYFSPLRSSGSVHAGTNLELSSECSKPWPERTFMLELGGQTGIGVACMPREVSGIRQCPGGNLDFILCSEGLLKGVSQEETG